MGLFKHILVPTDFGEPSHRALEMAVELAQAHGADLTVLHTFEVPSYPYEPYGEMSELPGRLLAPVEEAARKNLLMPLEEAARKKLDELVSSLSQRLPSTKGVLKVGIPWQEILAVVKEAQVDLLVMGTHGRRGMTHALLGSVAEKMVRMSPVPVLTVRTR